MSDLQVRKPEVDPWETIDARDPSYDPHKLIESSLTLRTVECAIWAMQFSANTMIALGVEDKLKMIELRSAAREMLAKCDPESHQTEAETCNCPMSIREHWQVKNMGAVPEHDYGPHHSLGCPLRSPVHERDIQG